MGRHASGPPPDPNDELRDIFRLEPFDEPSRRAGRLSCVVAVVSGVGTWAIEEFARAALGPWRYLFVVPLGLVAASTALGAAVYVLGEVVIKATANDAPNWLRFITWNLGNGLIGSGLGGVALVSFMLSFPQPWPLLYYVVCPTVGFVTGVVAGVLRSRRRRARWRSASTTPTPPPTTPA